MSKCVEMSRREDQGNNECLKNPKGSSIAVSVIKTELTRYNIFVNYTKVQSFFLTLECRRVLRMNQKLAEVEATAVFAMLRRVAPSATKFANTSAMI